MHKKAHMWIGLDQLVQGWSEISVVLQCLSILSQTLKYLQCSSNSRRGMISCYIYTQICDSCEGISASPGLQVIL